MLVFLVLAGNSFWFYVRTQCTIQLCGCVIFFVVVGKLILYEYLTVMIVSQKYWELSLEKNWSPIKPTYEKTNSFLLCMDLQSFRHDCFSKISRTRNLFLFLMNTLLLYLSLNPYGLFGGKANLVLLTLFYPTLLALTDRRTEERINPRRAR